MMLACLFFSVAGSLEVHRVLRASRQSQDMNAVQLVIWQGKITQNTLIFASIWRWCHICGLFSLKEGNMCPTMPGPATPALFRLNTVLQCIAILKCSNTFNAMLPVQYRYCNKRAIQSMSASKWNRVQLSAIPMQFECNFEQFCASLLQSSAMPERYSRVPVEEQWQPIVHWSGGQCLDR